MNLYSKGQKFRSRNLKKIFVLEFFFVKIKNCNIDSIRFRSYVRLKIGS